MKKILLVIILVGTCSMVNAQNLQPYLTGIMCNDSQKLQEFYVKNLDFRINDQREIPEQKIRFYLLEHDGFLFELIQRTDIYNAKVVLDTSKTMRYVRGYFKIGYTVDNVKHYYDRLVQNKVEIVSEDVTKNATRPYILFRDPEGNLVQLRQKA